MRVRTGPPFWRRALRAAGLRALHFAENNNDSHPARNGEAWLLRQLVKTHNGVTPLVVFDVGANVGDYTRSVLREASQAHRTVSVHAFEPSPHNVEILLRTFASQPNVQVNAVAIGDQCGEAILYSPTIGSSQASLLKRDPATVRMTEQVTVRVLRLEDYMAASGIRSIHLLKLDVEGAELAALRGLGSQLQPQQIEMIQFEYGGTALDGGTTLGEIYKLLSERGYAVAKLLPRQLEVRPYRVWMENYAYANYVALSPLLLDARER